MRHRTGNTDNTVDRVLGMLLVFGEQRPVLSAVELSELLGIPKSTTYRYISALRAHGLLEEEAPGQFGLGPRVLQMAHVAHQSFPAIRVAAPAMRQLWEATGETVILMRPLGRSAVVVDSIESRQPLRVAYERGRLVPLHAGAGARVLLAYLEPELVEEVLRGPFVRLTEHTVVAPERLRERVREIRRHGFEVSQQEVLHGAWAVAAPLFQAGRVAASLAIAAPAPRICPEDEARLRQLVVAAATWVTNQLDGWIPLQSCVVTRMSPLEGTMD